MKVFLKMVSSCMLQMIHFTDNNNFSNDDEILPASSGSGLAVTSDGHIVTNYDVVEGCQNVEITYKGETIPATPNKF